MKSISDYILTNFFMWKEFDSKKGLEISKEIIERKDSKKVIILFPYWTGKSRMYKNLIKKMPNYSYVLYDYPNEVLSEDVNLSLEYFNEIVNDACNLINSLRKKGYKEIILIGSSFGSNISIKIATKIKIDKIILNMIDSNLSKVIFTSPALKILKNKLQNNGFSLKKLEKIYKIISAEQTILDIKNKNEIKILLFLSRNDIFSNLNESKFFLQRLNKSKINYKLYKNHFLGHILGIYKNLFFSKKIIKFIKS